MCLNGQVVEAKTRDLNQGGVSLLSPLHLTKGMLLHLKFQVRLGMVYHMVEARCEVVHTVVGSGGSGFKVGLIFKQVSATDQNIMSKYLQG